MYFFFTAQQTVVGQGHHIIEASRDHTQDTSHSLRILWTRNRPVAEISTWKDKILKRDRRPWSRRDSNPQSQKSKRPQTLTLDGASTGIG